MTDVAYNYTKTPVATDRLKLEIQTSAIVTALRHCVLNGTDDLVVTMAGTLSGGDEDILDAIVDAHDGVSLTVEEPVNPDGRKIIHATSRKRGTFTCFTGAGDSQDDQSKVGGANGVLMAMNHVSGGGAISPIYVDLNTIANETMAHAGWMMWKDALNDLITLETVPKLSTYEAGSNTNYNLYGGYLIIPAAGNGTITPLTFVLVEVPINEYGNRSGAGYWNATYNTSTKVFGSITAAPTGTGRFNMFTVEVVLDRFMNRVPMLGSGHMPMDTYDASQIGHNMRMKLSFETRGDDHTWWWCGGLKPYRKRTV